MYMIIKIAAGQFSGAVTSSREILIWGSGDFGVLASPQKIFLDDIKFVDLKISKQPDGFAAAVDENGLMYSWGSNENGQLGQGDFKSRKGPSKVN